jgi:iron(III) transport system substrate-binding protein
LRWPTFQVRYDEEASKSLGLANLLIAERDNPRCDVFWNNQTLGTMRLKQQGVLESYKGAGYERIPERFRDPDGCWTGFAARFRVYLLAGDSELPDATAVAALISGEADLRQVAIAQPLFGTTLTHYTVLAAEMGLSELQAWHRSLRKRGIREVRGNSASRDLVAEGVCEVAFTDTDDAFGALDRGRDVRIVPVRTGAGATICIPNTVALIRGARHRQAAERLIEFLLSQDVELQLAASSSRQVPLGPVETDALPDEVRNLLPAVETAVDLNSVASMYGPVLKWLSAEYLP